MSDDMVQGQSWRFLVGSDSRITKDMSDSERYKILKDKKLVAKPYNHILVDSIPRGDFDALENIGNTEAFKILRKIGEQFGVFHQYANADMDVSFEFSKSNLRESVHKQSGAFQNYARMMSVFSDVIENAVGIEAHSERYKNATSQLDSVYVFVSAFNTESGTVPVLMEVKSFTDSTQSTLHIAVSLHEIERSRIVGRTYTDISAGVSRPIPASEYNIADIFQNVNPLDTRLIKYIPSGFLNKEQLDAKAVAQQEQEEYVARRNAAYHREEVQGQKRRETLTDCEVLTMEAEMLSKDDLNEGGQKNKTVLYDKTDKISKVINGVKYDGDVDTKKLNPKQKSGIRVLELLAAIGLDVHIFQSKIGADGKPIGENGIYKQRMAVFMLISMPAYPVKVLWLIPLPMSLHIL